MKAKLKQVFTRERMSASLLAVAVVILWVAFRFFFGLDGALLAFPIILGYLLGFALGGALLFVIGVLFAFLVDIAMGAWCRNRKSKI